MQRRLWWLIAARAAVFSVLLGSAVLIHVKSPASWPIDRFFLLIGVTLVLTLVYSITVRQATQHRWIIDAQLLIDALLVSAIVYATGGINSYFTSVYALPIIAASAVRGRRGGMIVVTASAVMYGTVVLAQYNGLVAATPGLGPDALPPGRVAQFTSPGFDVSIQESFTPLICGGTLVVPDEDLKVQGRVVYVVHPPRGR
jgi:hypothetical protein